MNEQDRKKTCICLKICYAYKKHYFSDILVETQSDYISKVLFIL